jgi:ribonucleoside-diphosphate reductase alpha chain
VASQDHTSGPEGFFRTDAKPVVRLQTAEGYNLRLTADHRLRRVVRYTRHSVDTEWCAAGELRTGDRVLLNDHRANTKWSGAYGRHEGYLIGLLLGDGTLKQNAAVLSVWQCASVANDVVPEIVSGIRNVMAEALAAAITLPHRADFVGWHKVAGRNEYRLATASIRDLAFDLGMRPSAKMITPSMEQTSSEFYQGFLRGLFDTDGSVQGSQLKGVSVRLSQSNLAFLEATQRMLLRLGIASTLYRERRPAGSSLLPDGKGGMAHYASRTQHELAISGENLLRFRDLIGFADHDKAIRLDALLANDSPPALRPSSLPVSRMSMTCKCRALIASTPTVSTPTTVVSRCSPLTVRAC